MAEPQSTPSAGDAGALVQFSIEKIYVKDLSLENPGAPQSFQMTEAPQIEIGLRTRGEQIAADTYECVLTLTVTARAGDKTVFLIEASQAGVFGIRGVGADQLQPVLAIHCPTVLFPYARETVADATMRAGFPPVQLAPILMYSTAICPYCTRAESYLRSKGVAEIAKVRVDLDPARRVEMMQRTGRRTVPQIYIGDRHVGGYEDLVALDRAGGLAPLLAM